MIPNHSQDSITQCYANVLGPLDATTAGLIIRQFYLHRREDLLEEWLGKGDEHCLVNKILKDYHGADNFCFEHESEQERQAYLGVLDSLAFIEPFRVQNHLEVQTIKALAEKERTKGVIYAQVYGAGPSPSQQYRQPSQPLSISR